MEQILSFIAANWLEWLFGVVVAVLGWLYRGIAARLQSEQVRNEAIAVGVQSLLRESIVDNYNKYSDRGYCPIYAKESIKRAYKAYHDGLGGNDVVTELYHKILAMPEDLREAENAAT